VREESGLTESLSGNPPRPFPVPHRAGVLKVPLRGWKVRFRRGSEDHAATLEVAVKPAARFSGYARAVPTPGRAVPTPGRMPTPGRALPARVRVVRIVGVLLPSGGMLRDGLTSGR